MTSNLPSFWTKPQSYILLLRRKTCILQPVNFYIHMTDDVRKGMSVMLYVALPACVPNWAGVMESTRTLHIS